MNPKHLLATCLIAFAFFIISCGGKDKKTNDEKTTTETSTKETTMSDDGIVPAIDTAALKDESSLLNAMQKVVDARIADDKKQKEDPNYRGHYLELIQLYSAVLRASTAYSQTFSDPNKALEFDKKLTDIQNKLYAK